MTVLKTLTDFEQAGLHSNFCLADGHAYQDLHPAFTHIIDSLPQIWHDASNYSIPEAELRFNNHYASFINAPVLNNFKNFNICPTASNSIDLIAAVLKNLQLTAVLVEPTFDNLALLVKRRGVPLSPIQDTLLFEAAELNAIEENLPTLKNYDVLFLVHPNNPTGLVLSENGFKNIVNFCKKHNMLIVIDNCFRVYRRTNFCDYSILIESSVSFIAFEDTGKVWPTQDMKASLIYYSDDLKKIIKELYNEIYLCVSNFSLAILSSFFDETAKVGLKQTIWDVVDSRRILLRKALAGSVLSVTNESINSTLPVEWLKYDHTDKNDIIICQELKRLNLAVLPGRQFYWNSSNSHNNQSNIRVSLMKRETIFSTGLDILQRYSASLGSQMNNKQAEQLTAIHQALLSAI